MRMRYVQVKHALLILQGKCTRENIAKAKQELLEGWSSAEEQHSEVGAKCGEASRAAQHTMYITRLPKKCDSLRLQHTMYIGGRREKREPNERR